MLSTMFLFMQNAFQRRQNEQQQQKGMHKKQRLGNYSNFRLEYFVQTHTFQGAFKAVLHFDSTSTTF